MLVVYKRIYVSVLSIIIIFLSKISVISIANINEKYILYLYWDKIHLILIKKCSPARWLNDGRLIRFIYASN